MRNVIAAYAACLTLLAAFALVGAAVVFEATGPSDAAEAAANRNSFNLVTWELKHLPQKWLYKIGSVFRDEEGSDDGALHRYFELGDEIDRLANEVPGSDALARAEDERGGLEARVEDIIEGRVTSVLEEQNLALEPPLFSDLGLIFPPVDFEIDPPPRVLAVSPRERIDLDESYLLTPGLSNETALAIEAGVEADDPDVSALVVTTGGVATYPSVIREGRSYERLVDTVFHEWLHQYLIFFPLGRTYIKGGESRTLNESVANIAGSELARLYFEKYGPLEAEPPPTPGQSPTPSAAPDPLDDPFDFGAEMRALRLDVEELLAAGRIEEAEALMERKRDEFEAKGRYIRRLNQAYFAFYGFYADTPASIDPIGPKLAALLERAGSPGEFVRQASAITSQADLDRLLGGG
ncbi:MAG: hypothetical protein J4O00_06465 [Chloroflexi bacterium]|nr:hypothetical protein [Chloroflexota bacterium]MCI0820366.1 hypothetical protein [Chloroflexota bacterium]MCI0839257.1 hypothetical protein [Chloroflexota bacterium]MCI0883804.1 hypothetical protein [Chloroflexota bacterium]MCI0885742.1 hypothetical protein [Chloroflexota bacterium]